MKKLYLTILTFIFITIFSSSFFPSMDGPAHLYNSNLLKEMMIGNSFLENYFSINRFYVPNWTSNIVMAILLLFFKGVIVEKILIISYIIGMLYSFKYLVKQLNPENEIFSLLIFPFIFSFLFRLGFYNFSIAFIFYFWIIAFWLKNYNNLNPVKLVMLFLLITILYYSNVLIFGFVGLTMGFHVIIISYRNYKSEKKLVITLKYFSEKILVLLGVSLYGLIAMIIFYSQVNFYDNSELIPKQEIIKWINDVRPLITYSYENEVGITSQVLHIFIFLLAISLINENRILNTLKFKIAVNKLTLMLPFFLSLFLLFLVPDGASAGMMSNRFILMFYIFLTIIIATITIKNFLSKVVLIIYLGLSCLLMVRHQVLSIIPLDKDAKEVYESGKYIKNNSIVLPVNLSDNWLQGHFSNYLGAEKPIVILENYEASVGWFPLKWNHKKMPGIIVAGKKEIESIDWVKGNESKMEKEIDYLCTTGNIKNLDQEKFSELKSVINEKFRIKYVSKNSFVHIFERR